MRAVFVDANATLAAVVERLHRATDMPLHVNLQPDVTAADLPALLKDAEIAIIDHTHLPTDIAKACGRLKHVIFLGTGARSYMNPDELAAECGITVHIIKGYGDTAVAEMAFALMWAAAKGLTFMDRGIRAGQWNRTDGMELTGKTIGLIGFGGIGAEMARLCTGVGMRVIAWNRTPRSAEGVTFVSLDQLLADSDVISLHMLLSDETRGFLSRDRIACFRQGAIFLNTARGAITDEVALAAAVESGAIRHIGLDVFAEEPLPAGHFLSKVQNATLSAHSAFRTPEASDNLIEAALNHCRRIAGGPSS
ncbi:3-phosphoglycerate dehydrogenase [Acidisoma cellulosilytica]|uniref:3-phosphoglycerate dehydrogenase n=1 Tax=Acidisoma cellulosilyticum TaxID=2802395 RepID=A0A963YZ55_9PROT|nr:NAD(P)-dependent oxidoreductase [Acidisoma cellulosilyticum]MCB8878858.1 3-phosphoglycerate dehydrogenase [Acidisoma cellulosilyticum]